MQLRTHPKMKWEGFSNWPPSWAAYGRGDIFSGEEEGVLTGVEIVKADNTSPRHLALRREQRGKSSGAPLHCDNEDVIPPLFEILKGCIGRPISQIGDLDVDL